MAAKRALTLTGLVFLLCACGGGGGRGKPMPKPCAPAEHCVSFGESITPLPGPFERCIIGDAVDRKAVITARLSGFRPRAVALSVRLEKQVSQYSSTYVVDDQHGGPIKTFIVDETTPVDADCLFHTWSNESTLKHRWVIVDACFLEDDDCTGEPYEGTNPRRLLLYRCV